MLSIKARNYLGLRHQMILYYSPPLPPELRRFLGYAISGSNISDCSEHVKCIILLICQDICHGISNGKWNLTKHILLTSTIYHLYRGKWLMTIINRPGHCESYSCISKLQNVMAMALEDVLSLITSRLVSGENNNLFHMDCDNLNKVATNIYGNNVNRTCDTMIQKVKREIDLMATIQKRTLPLYNRVDLLYVSTKVTEKIPPFQLYKEIGPKFSGAPTYKHPDINKAIYDKCLKEMHV